MFVIFYTLARCIQFTSKAVYVYFHLKTTPRLYPYIYLYIVGKKLCAAVYTKKLLQFLQLLVKITHIMRRVVTHASTMSLYKFSFMSNLLYRTLFKLCSCHILKKIIHSTPFTFCQRSTYILIQFLCIQRYIFL